LVPDLETAGRNGGAKRAIELRVDRSAIPRVDGNEGHCGHHVF
jgi:hypothetical protein